MVKIGVELVNIGGKQAKNRQENEEVWATSWRRVNSRASSSHAGGAWPYTPAACEAGELSPFWPVLRELPGSDEWTLHLLFCGSPLAMITGISLVISKEFRVFPFSIFPTGAFSDSFWKSWDGREVSMERVSVIPGVLTEGSDSSRLIVSSFSSLVDKREGASWMISKSSVVVSESMSVVPSSELCILSRSDPHHPDSDSPRFLAPVLTSFLVPVFHDCLQAAEIIIRKRILIIHFKILIHHDLWFLSLRPLWFLSFLIVFKLSRSSSEDGRWESASILVDVHSCLVASSLSPIDLEFYWDSHHPFQDSDSPHFVVPFLTSTVVPVFPYCLQGKRESASILVEIRSCLLPGSLSPIDLEFYRDPHHPFQVSDSP
ncbi:uncharacterized protein G2W53_014527 [Senna tora]|uniref:Uncharacterized protein n=1 Tax=Senna tora TaxID=362788 RepID=A0A834WTN3_9FABA|nr:uncharacterized protein G2W53_014527 [Senna tora]